jgi:hypothetical protein
MRWSLVIFGSCLDSKETKQGGGQQRGGGDEIALWSCCYSCL